jgi:hypothetical protein
MKAKQPKRIVQGLMQRERMKACWEYPEYREQQRLIKADPYWRELHSLRIKAGRAIPQHLR